MADEKTEWSEQQPEKWEGAPIGSTPPPPPPAAPPIDASQLNSEVPLKFGKLFAFIFATTKKLLPRMFVLGLVIAGVGATVAYLGAHWMYTGGHIDDTTVDIIKTVNGGTQQWTEADWEMVKSRILGMIVMLAFMVVVIVATQIVFATVMTALTLRHFTGISKPMPWYPVFRSQLTLFGVTFSMFLPAGLIYTFSAGGGDLGFILGTLALIAAAVAAIWLSISTTLLNPLAAHTGTAGFEAVSDTVTFSRGVRWLTLGLVLVTSILSGIPGSFVSSALDAITKNGSLESQFYYMTVSQFIAMPITLPVLAITTTTVYAIKKKIIK